MFDRVDENLKKEVCHVLVYEKTFVITDEYGEGGQVPVDKFMIVSTSNMKNSNLGKGVVLKNAQHIDDILQPLIMTNIFKDPKPPVMI